MLSTGVVATCLKLKDLPLGQNQIIVDCLQAAARADSIEKFAQIVIMAEKSMKAVVDFCRAAVRKGHLPAAGFAAEVGVSLEQCDFEAALTEQRCRTDSASPAPTTATL